MTTSIGVSRRALVGAAAGALAAPTILRLARGEQPIRIGMPCALTGPGGEIGEQMRTGAVFWAKQQNAKGGLLGRPIEIDAQDTGGDPATCVRKAQEVVERDGCHLLMGMTLSSEALAVVPKLAEWNAIFMSSDNGDGRLTGSSFVPNFFRANISGPMETRVISLYLRKAGLSKFYALGMDYAWGHNSIGVFEDEVKKAGKSFLGAVYSPIGTKDFSTYITKIRQSGADACFLVLQGADNNAFLLQAHEYRLPGKVQLLTSIVDLNSIQAVGEAALGLTGSTRYTFLIDHVANKDFVAAWQKEHGRVPDVFEGEQWQACEMLRTGIEAASSIDADKLRPALEAAVIDSIKGKVAMRACDHQAVQAGYVVKVGKQEGFKFPVPQIVATFPGDQITPACRQMTFDT
ncbi:MAG: ABC transporter substrate-binding protein [Acetobacteraceae bacterium]|nr:ABC transporter substrate-binding protein [Acetobacteraceae bacterium]